MSKQLSLIDYPCEADGQFHELEKAVIISSFIPGDTVDQLVSDVKKHPSTDLHVLIGGSGLTKTAKEKLDKHSSALCEEGKAIVYILNEGGTRLANELKAEILSALGNLTGPEVTTGYG